MATSKRPVVLLIDDSEDQLLSYGAALRTRATVIPRHPNDVTAADLRKSNVVLVDYVIENWKGRDSTATVSLQPRNGVALSAVLRSNADARKQRRAFAIHSGKLSELGGGLPAQSREHVIARTLNLEWVFRKEGNAGKSMPEQVCELADAIASLPPAWPNDPKKATGVLLRLLSVPTRRQWKPRAEADVEACRPPAYAGANSTNGFAVVRWLLQQILPYPCFLWDVHYVAARLRVTPESLVAALRDEQKARRALATVRYGGILSSFLGSRWWRVGIEQTLWDWTGGKSFDAALVREAVSKRVSANLEHVQHPQPVVCVDDSFRPSTTIIDVSDAVEVRPDDWPGFADQAWVRRSTAEEDPDVAALVPQQDKAVLKRS